MKQTRILKSCLAAFSLLLLSSPTAYAYDRSLLNDVPIVKNVEHTVNANEQALEHRSQKAVDATSKHKANGSDVSAQESEHTERRQNRFNAQQIKKCEKQQQHISAKLDTISLRGAKQLEVFHSIASRVQTFYTQKGYAAPGYESTVGELDNLYDQSLVAVTTTQNAKDSWNCTIDDPIASLATFKDAKRAETLTLKTYKDKVLELILLVKKAGGSN